MRVAIVHPWFLAHGGAEQVVVAIASLYPEADIFTIFCENSSLPKELHGRRISSSKWNFLPWKYTYYRQLLPLYAFAFEAMDLRGYDLIISSDSTIAKGILTDQSAIHICYCHSPMRCLYDQYREFRAAMSVFVRPLFIITAHHLRIFDYVAAQKVTELVAISQNIRERLLKFYGRDSKVVFPPVITDTGYISSQLGDYYLSVGRLTQPKRVDLLILACNRLGRRLIVVGTGRDASRLRKIAGPTIEFTGRVPDSELADLYARCRAFLFAANEDFGIVPVEAQSYGRPVIALGRGGALETVVDGVSGLFFGEETVESLCDALLRFEVMERSFEPEAIVKNSARFDISVFTRQLENLIADTIANNRKSS